MSTLADVSDSFVGRSRRLPWSELRSSEPRLTAMTGLFLAAMIPLALASMVDHRTVNDINVWIKPMKFLGSLAIYFATLAWLHGYLPEKLRRSFWGGSLVTVPIAVGLLEMTWLVATSALGVPSHFNRSAPAYEISYALAGLGATLLMVVVLAMGIVIGRSRGDSPAPALRFAIVLGCSIAFVGTMVTAGYLASGTGHWVGASPTDAGGLPVVGWSRTGGDLRVAHFFSMHALQVIPLFGWVVARSSLHRRIAAVWTLSAAYAGLILWTFVQALQGRPFL